MSLAASIKTDPLLFDKLLEPLQQPLAEFAKQPLSQAAVNLTSAVFVRLLLFRLFAQTRSARDLLTAVQSSPTAQALGFFKLGLSTFHDGFGRYPSPGLPAWCSRCRPLSPSRRWMNWPPWGKSGAATLRAGQSCASWAGSRLKA